MTKIDNEGSEEIVLDFIKKQLGLYPEAIFIDQHEDTLVITLSEVLSDAEKNAVTDKNIADKIARTLSEAFRSVASIFKIKVSSILGRNITEASLVIDVPSNCATIFMKYEDNCIKR